MANGHPWFSAFFADQKLCPNFPDGRNPASALHYSGMKVFRSINFNQNNRFDLSNPQKITCFFSVETNFNVVKLGKDLIQEKFYTYIM